MIPGHMSYYLFYMYYFYMDNLICIHIHKQFFLVTGSQVTYYNNGGGGGGGGGEGNIVGPIGLVLIIL